MANIKLKDQLGAEITYNGIKHMKIPNADGGTLEFDMEAVVQEKTVEITQNGIAEILPDSGYDGLSKVIVTTDIPSGGDEAEEVTVDLQMAGGDQVITPSAGKSIAKATVTKPETLLAENIRKDIVIGGVSGSLDPDAAKNELTAAAWSDNEVLCSNGFGYARLTDHGIDIKIWSDVNDISLVVDTGYESYFRKALSWGKIANSDLEARLNAFCSDLVTNHSDIFDTVFSGAAKACFMDTDHPIDIPTIPVGTEATADGFMETLKSTLSGFPKLFEFGFMDPSDYGSGLSCGAIQSDEPTVMPFLWFPAVEDGEMYISHYIMQQPAGAMATYTQNLKTYSWVGTAMGNEKSIMLGFVNAMPIYGMNYNIAAMSIGTGFVWWSAGAQTLSEALIASLNPDWTYGDVALSAGYNLTVNVANGTNATVPATDETLANYWIGTNNIPFDKMDEYEKSFFLGIAKQRYKRLNQNHVSIEFVLRNPE